MMAMWVRRLVMGWQKPVVENKTVISVRAQRSECDKIHRAMQNQQKRVYISPRCSAGLISGT